MERQVPPSILPLRSYRATLIPAHVLPDDIEVRAGQGVLPTVQLKAVNSGMAEQLAHWVTGKPVHSVVRVEPVVQASGPMVHVWFKCPTFGLNDEGCQIGDWPRIRDELGSERIVRAELVGSLA